jgi:hypothetical protein
MNTNRKNNMADWKAQLAKLQKAAPATQADPHAHAKMLISKVRKLDDECMLVLSSKQQDWLDDLLEYADRGAWSRFTTKSIEFLETCASGFYTERKLPSYNGK